MPLTHPPSLMRALAKCVYPVVRRLSGRMIGGVVHGATRRIRGVIHAHCLFLPRAALLRTIPPTPFAQYRRCMWAGGGWTGARRRGDSFVDDQVSYFHCRSWVMCAGGSARSGVHETEVVSDVVVEENALVSCRCGAPAQLPWE
eukprot:CAMPEP_0179463750 /NCGR_PEP_ID=MMETSP0799-20121207/45722_1 /TAXON_ID=46947 /ORGANISM="Geminigera cryophila, Strain CCMP2564" /LENGTH=143 /DNA_ID=CAMNT_0021267157 /DNA_START=92 /DNA_END=523 /DNA_ORIENTATION=-